MQNLHVSEVGLYGDQDPAEQLLAKADHSGSLFKCRDLSHAAKLLRSVTVLRTASRYWWALQSIILYSVAAEELKLGYHRGYICIYDN